MCCCCADMVPTGIWCVVCKKNAFLLPSTHTILLFHTHTLLSPQQIAQYSFAAASTTNQTTNTRDMALLLWQGGRAIGCGTAVANSSTGPSPPRCEVVVCWYDVPSYAPTPQAYSSNIRSPARPQGTCSDGVSVLGAHNAARTARGGPVVVWDAGLAEDAGQWSRQLAGRGCPADTSRSTQGDVSSYGENVFAAVMSSNRVGDFVCCALRPVCVCVYCDCTYTIL